jgi:hypothetical protein
MTTTRARLRRPRWLSRPVAVLLAVVVGLGGLGGATGALLGELGGGPGLHQHRGQPGEGRHHDARVGDLRNGVDGDGDDGVPGPGPAR